MKNSSPLPPYFFTIIGKSLQLYSPQKNFTKNWLFPYNYWGTFLTCLLKDNPYQYLISSLQLFEKLTNFPPTKESLLIPPYFIKFNSETFRLSSWNKKPPNPSLFLRVISPIFKFFSYQKILINTFSSPSHYFENFQTFLK